MINHLANFICVITECGKSATTLTTTTAWSDFFYHGSDIFTDKTALSIGMRVETTEITMLARWDGYAFDLIKNYYHHSLSLELQISI